MPFLTSQDDSVVKKKFELGGDPVTIGRHPECDVVIEDVSVSRQHAQVIRINGTFYVEDLHSRNGTLVNNGEVHSKTRLFDGSEIKICDVLFTFRVGEEQINPPKTGIPHSELGLIGANGGAVFLEEGDGNSTIMSQVEVLSSHSGVGKVSLEKKLKALMDITQALAHPVERSEILRSALGCLFGLFLEADRGFVAFSAPDNKVDVQIIETRNAQIDEQIRISRTVFNRVIESRQAILSHDATADSRFDLSQSIADFRIRSMICAPILNADQEAIGVIQLDTLRQKVAFQEEDLEVLATVAVQIGITLQRLEHFEEEKRNEQVKTDLEIAHQVQRRFLPQGHPEIEGYDFHAYYRAAERVGGDYYDYIQLDDDHVAVIVADVVGHGIAAALLMAKLSGEARFAMASNLDPIQAFENINKSLNGLNLDKFVTAIMGLFNTKTHQVTFVNAGHMGPILKRASGEVCSLEIEGAGLPLGILEDTTYGSSTYEIKSGDVFLMYTDGVNESMNTSGEVLGTKRLLEEIRVSQAKTPESIGKVVYDSVKRFVAGGPQHDDICYVSVGR